MKKIGLAVILLFLAFSLFAGGQKENTVPAAGKDASSATTTAVAESARVRYVIPGDPPKDAGLVMEAVNTKLKADAGIELEITYVPWDVWEQKINLMLTTGEEFDLFHVMQPWIPFSTYHSKGGLSDITDAIGKYGANIVKAIPAEMWEGAKIDGRIYTVPAFWVELASEGNIMIRKDLLNANELSLPRNPDELLAAMEIVSKNWKGKNKMYMSIVGGSADAADPLGVHSTALHRAYSSFPFTIMDKLFYVSQTGVVKSWVETEEFKKDATWFRKAYQKGFLHPDILTLKQDHLVNLGNSGNWLFTFGSGVPLDQLQKNWQGLKDSDIETFKLNPEKPNVRPLGIKNCNSVPSTSKSPESAIKFLDWLYANQENYDLFMYGIEGKHYNKIGTKKKETILDGTGSFPLYGQADWMIGNLNYIIMDKGISSAAIKDLYVIDENAINSPAADFTFDASNVRAELANVMTEFASYIVPIYLGVVDFDKNYPQTIEKLKVAGLDKVVAEYKKQFAAFIASRGK